MTMRPESPFANPTDLAAAGGGSKLRIGDLDGKLVVMKPEPDEIELETTLGTATARPVAVLVVGESDQWQPALIFGRALLVQLGQAVRAGRPVVGVVGHGEAQPGRSAPWVLHDATAAQVELARAAWSRVEAGF
jgi:hypothetical protein